LFHKTNFVTDLYFTAILCPDNLSQKIKAIQRSVAEKYNSRHALKSPPHITLVPPFRMNIGECIQLRETLSSFMQSRTPFELSLQEFNCFENNKVIYINVVGNTALTRLFSELAEFTAKNLNSLVKRKHQNFTPHITIASRDLNSEMFAAAWKEFKEEQFRETFEVNSIFLLRHTGIEWIPITEFMFDARENIP
jgi:2'-5' RNA ligase